MKSLRFKKLWLVSETERAARRVEFSSMRTLLVGRNHTGKSTVVKHLFWTLGCETKGKSDRWDSLVISVLEFELDGNPYTAYRRANIYALRNDSTAAVRVTTSYPEWSEFMAGLFDFRLMLPTHQNTMAQATPPYLFLPFYMDQDKSWLQQWNSFEKLTQFSNWKKPLAAYFTGQRPNGYYVARFEESKAKTVANQISQELGVVQAALDRVKKTLPQQKICLDIRAFKQELSELIRSSTKLKNEQELLRKKAFEYAAQKESLTSQVAMARDALRDLEGDLKYLTDGKLEQTVTCPTCGTAHENGFPIRLELIDDAATIRRVVAELEEDQRKINENLAETHGKLNRIKRKSHDIEKTLQAKKGMLRLQDIVDSQSIEVVRGVFNKDLVSLRRKLAQQEEIAAGMKEKVAKFDYPERTKEINEFYSERVELFASELGVQDLREEVKKRPEASITSSGSALPRSLLTYQYAVLHTANEKGDAKHFPVVVDSPNQQGQDADHLMQMLNFIVKRTPNEHQLILAVEDIPKGFSFDGSIVELKTPYGLLDTNLYDTACAELDGLVSSVAVEIDGQLERRRHLAQE